MTGVGAGVGSAGWAEVFAMASGLDCTVICVMESCFCGGSGAILVGVRGFGAERKYPWRKRVDPTAPTATAMGQRMRAAAAAAALPMTIAPPRSSSIFRPDHFDCDVF